MPDAWAEWLLSRRFAGEESKQRQLEELARTRDRLLDAADLKAGQRVLDVGCGDGLIGFGALVRGAREVVFSDVSDDLLVETKDIADVLGMANRSRFLQASADDLSELASATMDLVTTRSVLIFVDRKQAAFNEFIRVLRPGGRISIFEPINRLNRFRRSYDTTGVQDLDDRVQAVFDNLQPVDSDAMLNFDDRDLLRWVEAAGFADIRLTLEVTAGPPQPQPWESWANVAWNPKVPTLEEAISSTLTPAEAERYTAHLKVAVEQGRGSRRMARAWLTAVKPIGDVGVGRALGTDFG